MRIDVRNDNVDKALKILKKRLFDEGTINELMERRYYEKPSETKRRKKIDAKRQQQRAVQKEQQMRMRQARRSGAKVK
jgi:small subunit ribosomal protein S21